MTALRKQKSSAKLKKKNYGRSMEILEGWGQTIFEVGVRRYGGGRRGKQKFEVWKFKDHNRKAHVS